ncbi:SPOR domain-containing protein [Guyparkeria hydrothermalis]|nr:SPOR domain-containing protein [Guyparkeria hydrothermalis]
MTGRGTVPVEIEVVGPGQQAGGDRDNGNWQATKVPKSGWGDDVFVQVGAFRDRDNAEAIGAKLRRAGLSPVSQVEGGLTRVRVGPFASAAEYDSALERLRELGFHDARMVVMK